jgi:hypothetical protein
MLYTFENVLIFAQPCYQRANNLFVCRLSCHCLPYSRAYRLEKFVFTTQNENIAFMDANANDNVQLCLQNVTKHY